MLSIFHGNPQPSIMWRLLITEESCHSPCSLREDLEDVLRSTTNHIKHLSYVFIMNPLMEEVAHRVDKINGFLVPF